jgi:alanyl-tRNA synthetase
MAEAVFDIMKSACPELAEAAAFITNVIKNVEIRFLITGGPRMVRFDFSHFHQVEADDRDTIETLVNQRIHENLPTGTQEMDAEDAFKSVATALFEEKYGDRVRVVSLTDFSRELCGGTYTAQTGNIGVFKLVSESSVASGVRMLNSNNSG